MRASLVKNGLSLSIIVGTLLVPLTALAAIWLTNPDRESAPTTAVANEVPAMPASLPPSTGTATRFAADLRAACGPDGMLLVSLEQSGTISDVQQAALDALRDVCEQQGTPLPSKPTPEPIVQTIVVPATATARLATGTTPTTLHSENEDEHEHELEHEHEHEDEHEDDD